MPTYDNDGKIRLTQSPGSGFVGRYAPDGSLYYTLAPGSGFCGSTAPDGSMYVVDAGGANFGGLYAANGAIRVTQNNELNGAMQVSEFTPPVTTHDFITAGTVPAWMTFARADGSARATYFNSLGVLKTVTSAADPRFDYDPATLAANGLLIEAAFTNLVLQSGFASGWTTSRATMTGGAAAGIDGNNSAATFIEDTTATNTHVSFQTISFTTGQNYFLGAVVKAKGRNWIGLRFSSAAFTSFLTGYFNLSTGVVGSVTSPATSGIINLGNGFYYCWITATATATISASTQFFLCSGDNGIIYTGDGTSGVYIHYGIVGVGSFRRSLIATTASTIAVAADVLSQSTYSANAQIWQRKSISTGTVDRIYYAAGSAPSTLPTGYWYQSAGIYNRNLTAGEQTTKTVVGASY